MDFGDENANLEFPETRGIMIDSDDFDIIVTGKKRGQNDQENTWAYLRPGGAKRAPLAHVTKLVVYYERSKLIQKEKESKYDSAMNTDGLELMEKVVAKTAALLRDGDYETVLNYIEA